MEQTTTKLSDFGIRERQLAQELLNAWNEQGLPDDFYPDQVEIIMNRHSGFVFLTNSEYQVAMMNGDRLESFYVTPYDGIEGFLEELLEQVDGMCDEDREWVLNLS